MLTPQEARALIDAAKSGALPKLTRRPDFFELKGLIFPGSVVIYDASAITRWRDGLSWSQPRRVNGFLTYIQRNNETEPSLMKQLFTDDTELKLVSYQNVPPYVLPAPIVDPVHVSQPSPVCFWNDAPGIDPAYTPQCGLADVFPSEPSLLNGVPGVDPAYVPPAYPAWSDEYGGAG